MLMIRVLCFMLRWYSRFRDVNKLYLYEDRLFHPSWIPLEPQSKEILIRWRRLTSIVWCSCDVFNLTHLVIVSSAASDPILRSPFLRRTFSLYVGVWRSCSTFLCGCGTYHSWLRVSRHSSCKAPSSSTCTHWIFRTLSVLLLFWCVVVMNYVVGVMNCCGPKEHLLW